MLEWPVKMILHEQKHTLLGSATTMKTTNINDDNLLYQCSYNNQD